MDNEINGDFIVLLIPKVPKEFRGAKTRSPLQQLNFCIHDAQTVAPLKTYFRSVNYLL